MSYDTIEVRKVTPNIGAEIHGVNLAKGLSNQQFDEIHRALLENLVIFVRELGATILLYAQGTETISVTLVALSERSFGYVAALAVLQLMLLLIAFSLFRATRASLIQA